MGVPQNAQAIYSWLTGHGYSKNAAAGIVGNIQQESGGNPEAGGPGNGGIIQWTPASKAAPNQPIMTGNASKDLQTQLVDMLTYNSDQGAGAMAQLNAASTPQAAALIYSQLFERPLASAANNPNREQSAADVAAAAASGNWQPNSSGGPAPSPGSAGSFGNVQWYNPISWLNIPGDATSSAASSITTDLVHIAAIGAAVAAGVAIILLGLARATHAREHAENITENVTQGAGQVAGVAALAA